MTFMKAFHLMQEGCWQRLWSWEVKLSSLREVLHGRHLWWWIYRLH